MASLAEAFPREEKQSFEITEASEITVTPDQVIIVAKKSKDTAEALRNYRRNVWWFLALVVLSSAWFYRHFETYFSQALVVGVPLTYAVWQVGFSYWKTFWQTNARELRRKWLSQKSTTLQLAGLCAGVLLFLIGTSSVWVSLAPGPIRTATIEVHYQGKRFMPRIELAESSRIGGRLYFPRFVPRRVQIVVTSPKRWVKNEPSSQVLWPWTAMNFTFPADFHERPKRALRILPGSSLRDEVGINGSPYTLTVREGNHPPRTIPNYPFATFYAGLGEWDELRAVYQDHNTAAWGSLLERKLITDHFAPENARRYASHWVTRSILARMHDFSDGNRVTVTLGIPGQTPIATATSDPLKTEMTTLFLEKP